MTDRILRRLSRLQSGMRCAGYLVAVAVLTIRLCSAQNTNPSSPAYITSSPAETPQDQRQNIPAVPCGEAGADAVAGCHLSSKELKDAKAAFSKGLKLQKARHLSEAFEAFQNAAHLAPRNIDYVTAREMSRQQVAFDALQRGNTAMLDGRPLEALADFRAAAQIDPPNEFAQQRVRDALAEKAPTLPLQPRVVMSGGILRLEPIAARADFHYRGDGRELLLEVAKAFGIEATFDESVVGRPVHFDITDVDFDTAMQAACDVTHTFWTPVQAKQILVAVESADNHHKFDRMAIRTFYLPELSTPADFNNLANLLRTLFDIKIITAEPTANTIAINAPAPLLDAATQFIEGLDHSRPEVMLDVSVYQIDYTLMRNMGLQIPNQFQLFNIPAAALVALAGTNVQDLINQLIASGGINQANSQAISALLAQAQAQSQQSSVFSQPVATFGNGTTLMGLSLGTLSAQLSLNQSWVSTLEHSTLRVSQGNEATFRVGSRYPILNATFSPIFNTPAIAQVIGNNSFQAAFPSFSYEDIGLSLKANPAVSRDNAVSLHVQMQFRTLLGQSLNGVPIIANREFEGTVTLRDGEPAVVAGAVTRSDTRSMAGIPGLGLVPGLNQIMTSNNKQENSDELLIVITPRVVSESTPGQAIVWMPRGL